MVIDPPTLGRAVPPPDPAAARADAVASALAAVARPPPPAEALIVPPSDKRAYRRFVLPNGMTVLLVHDPSMVEAASKGVDEEDGGETDKKQGGGSKEGNNPAREPGAASGSSSGSDASGSSSGSSGSDDDDADDDGGSSGAGSPSAAPHHAPTKKAAAAVAVSTGSLADPPAFPGLAHYLEHMLFMGSAKYPDENDYDAFLAKHGGSSNAFTDMEETVYYFDCTPGALLPALDRFAQFFTCPLVKADALEREVGAVDNEFSGVLQSDGCRLAQLRAHTARRGHPYARFAWGNRASLADKPRAAGLDVRAAILDFYAAQYGAERMTLVVVGGQALAELAAAVGAAFGAVPSARPCRVRRAVHRRRPPHLARRQGRPPPHHLLVPAAAGEAIPQQGGRLFGPPHRPRRRGLPAGGAEGPGLGDGPVRGRGRGRHGPVVRGVRV